MNNISGITFTYALQDQSSHHYLPNIALIYAHPECDRGADLKHVFEDNNGLDHFGREPTTSTPPIPSPPSSHPLSV
jgi:hypothetical protein